MSSTAKIQIDSFICLLCPCLFNICHLDVHKLLFIYIYIQCTDKDLVKSKRLFYNISHY